MTQLELLNMHVDALFAKDKNDRLVSVNEPWDNTKPAPLLYIGKTLKSESVLYARYDVDDEIFSRASALIQSGVMEPQAFAELFDGPYLCEEVCYSIPAQHRAYKECVILTQHNLHDFDLHQFGWLTEEIDVAQPCCAFLDGRKVVSVCRSVRIAKAHEAGIETAMEYRGNGYAKEVLATWSMEVFKLGKTPLYSTSITNLSSQRVASKSGLPLFATGFSINAKNRTEDVR